MTHSREDRLDKRRTRNPDAPRPKVGRPALLSDEERVGKTLRHPALEKLMAKGERA